MTTPRSVTTVYLDYTLHCSMAPEHRAAGRRTVEERSRLPASWAGSHPWEESASDQGRRSDGIRVESSWCCRVGVTPCCCRFFFSIPYSYRQVPGDSVAV